MEFIIGKTVCRFLILAIWFWDIQHALPEKTEFEPKPHAPGKFMLSDPPMGLFDPIEIAPGVIPRNPYPVQPLSPMYPSFPRIYEPILSGKCPINFSSMSVVIDKTASDCSAPLAALVGNVICCPQVNSLMHIFQGSYVSKSNLLVFQQSTANYCFSDLINILVSRGANNTISTLCSVKSSNLTGGSCPVKDLVTFEKSVNTSKLLESCSSIDQLKECCRPTCQPAIMEAAMQISLRGAKASMIDGSRIPGSASSINAVNDCKGVVYSWLSEKISPEAANIAFRILSGCKVNKVCPLEFEEPTSIIKACGGSAPSSLSCCSSLHTYIESIQRQMLITNRQAINCATLFGSMLQKGGIMANIYELCKVELKDFSLQSYGQQGCLLRSLPADIVFDNITGFSFTCDLSDNIAAPWPSSSSLSSLSLCAPEMSLPALPVPLTTVSSGCHNIARTIAILAYIISSLLLLWF